MKNIKMGPKLITSYMLIAFMTLGTCIFLLGELSEVNDGTTELYEEAVLSIINLLNSERIIQELRIENRNALQAETPEERSVIQRRKDSLVTEMRNVYAKEEKITLTDEAKDIAANVKRYLDEYSERFDVYIDDLNHGAERVIPRN